MAEFRLPQRNGEMARVQQSEILPPGSRMLFVSDGADGNWLQAHGRKPLINRLVRK